ncbi:hypothetical protein DFQ28_000134, partial [Apophysomyces sp. BC1034]
IDALMPKFESVEDMKSAVDDQPADKKLEKCRLEAIYLLSKYLPGLWTTKLINSYNLTEEESEKPVGEMANYFVNVPPSSYRSASKPIEPAPKSRGYVH